MGFTFPQSSMQSSMKKFGQARRPSGKLSKLERRQAELKEMVEKFNISEADLAAVRAELAETQQTLVDTTAVLDVREEKLETAGTKGNTTRVEGVKASEDVAALHLKVERKASVVSQNASSAQNLSSGVSDGINTLVTNIREAVAARKQQDDELCVASGTRHSTC